jgi:iron(III) transport system permease protein
MRSFRTVSMVVLAIYSVLVIAPVLAFAVPALLGGLSPEVWADLWRRATRTNLLWNSLEFSLLTATAATVIGVPLGYLLARTDVPGRRVLTGLCASPLFLPPFFWAKGWQMASGAHGMTGMGGAAFVMTLALFPIVPLLSGVGFSHIDPSLEDDARTLTGEAGVFRYVALPVASPLIAAAFLLVFVVALSEFGVPALMQVNAYPVAVFTAFSAFYDFGQAAALCLPFLLVAALLAAAIYAVTQRMEASSLAEHWEPRRIRLGRGRAAAAGIALLLLAGGLGPPVAAFLAQASGDNLWEDVRQPLLLSLGLAAAGATSLTLIGLPVAWVCQRGYARGGAWWLQGQTLLFALPSTIVGLGLVSLWNRAAFAWLYGTAAMIVLGSLARFGPVAVRAFGAFLAQVPRDCEEAIWLDGGGVTATLRHFVAPVSRRAVGMVWALSFVLCMGELATTILVAPLGTQTLAVRLFTIEANAPAGRVSSLALVLAASCLLPLILWGTTLAKEAER